MNFKTYLNARKELIDRQLDNYLPAEKRPPATIHKAMRYSVFSGGKRIRPVIALESCAACGGKTSDCLPAACAIELVHAYSLVHDDLPSMDNDDYRRGKPTCHKMFGEANAILAGDALLTLAFDVLAGHPDTKVGMAAIRELSKAAGTEGMVGGQVLDLESKDKKKNKKMTEHINRLKTAMLFEASCRLGAITAKADKDRADALARYGACLGAVFQLTDDMIDGVYDGSIPEKAKADHDIKVLAGRAKGSLRIFGNKARRLMEIADYVAGRSQ